jgi:hypothetical protein
MPFQFDGLNPDGSVTITNPDTGRSLMTTQEAAVQADPSLGQFIMDARSSVMGGATADNGGAGGAPANDPSAAPRAPEPMMSDASGVPRASTMQPPPPSE